MVAITIKYNVILLGGSRVGKKSFIQAAEQMFQKEALLSSSYLNIGGENENPNNNSNNNNNNSETNGNNIKNKRMSISESIQSLGNTIKSSPIMSILGGGNGNNSKQGNNNSSNAGGGNKASNTNSRNSEYMNNMIVEDLRKQISEYDSFQEQDLSQQVASLPPTPPNTIVVLKDYVRYELHVTSFYDTGFTDEEREEVVKADGYFIMIDLTNRFSVQRAKMFYKKLQQICDPHYSSKAESNNRDFLGSGTGINGSGDSSESSPPAIKLPLILLGSKSDEQLGKKRQISTIEGLRLSDAWNCPFMECSTMQAHNKGIDSAIREMINIISQKKKRASIALNNAHSPSKNKRFSWRKSLSLVVGGHYHNDRLNEDLMADVASIKTPSPSNPCTNAHNNNSTPTSSSCSNAGTNSSNNTNAKSPLETPASNSNRQRARTPNHDNRRHSIAIGKNLKGLIKFGRNRPKINPVTQPYPPNPSTTSTSADRKSKHLSAPPRSASEEAIEAETIVKNKGKKKWFNKK